MSGELLLELLSEEIPARMQRRGLRDLIDRLQNFLGDQDLSADELKGYVTPRRLVVVGTGIPERVLPLQRFKVLPVQRE
jgi:glycyl-tRNA synthetase beta chain